MTIIVADRDGLYYDSFHSAPSTSYTGTKIHQSGLITAVGCGDEGHIDWLVDVVDQIFTSNDRFAGVYSLEDEIDLNASILFFVRGKTRLHQAFPSSRTIVYSSVRIDESYDGPQIQLGSGRWFFSAYYAEHGDIRTALELTAAHHPECGGPIESIFFPEAWDEESH